MDLRVRAALLASRRRGWRCCASSRWRGGSASRTQCAPTCAAAAATRFPRASCRYSTRCAAGSRALPVCHCSKARWRHPRTPPHLCDRAPPATSQPQLRLRHALPLRLLYVLPGASLYAGVCGWPAAAALLAAAAWNLGCLVAAWSMELSNRRRFLARVAALAARQRAAAAKAGGGGGGGGGFPEREGGSARASGEKEASQKRWAAAPRASLSSELHSFHSAASGWAPAQQQQPPPRAGEGGGAARAARRQPEPAGTGLWAARRAADAEGGAPWPLVGLGQLGGAAAGTPALVAMAGTTPPLPEELCDGADGAHEGGGSSGGGAEQAFVMPHHLLHQMLEDRQQSLRRRRPRASAPPDAAAARRSAASAERPSAPLPPPPPQQQQQQQQRRAAALPSSALVFTGTEEAAVLAAAAACDDHGLRPSTETSPELASLPPLLASWQRQQQQQGWDAAPLPWQAVLAPRGLLDGGALPPGGAAAPWHGRAAAAPLGGRSPRGASPAAPPEHYRHLSLHELLLLGSSLADDGLGGAGTGDGLMPGGRAVELGREAPAGAGARAPPVPWRGGARARAPSGDGGRF